MDLGIKGRTALITGGSKGIGLFIAERLAEEGCNLVLVARGLEDLERARQDLQKFPVDVHIWQADLSQEASVRAVAAAFPGVDILVNNAGAIQTGTLEEIDDALWRSYWDLKVYGYINLTRAYYTLMKARGRGVIINIIGAAGERMRHDYIAGTTGNASLMAFTKALGAASPDHGIRVVGVNPASVLTDKTLISFRKKAREKFGDEQRWKELTASKPFGRTITPLEISAVVAFLASDLAGYMSGTVVTVDGGLLHRYE